MFVAAAMSGGVDSSVAAALLVREGHSVIGVTMHLAAGNVASPRACCPPEAVRDARNVCRVLGIPHYMLNLSGEFERLVVEPFVAGYLAGLTPNPCVACNRRIKFEVLWRRLGGAGVDCLATGHYVRLGYENGRHVLRRGADRGRDQSYFLHTLTQEQLARLLCPLGGLTKDEVRGLAREWGLPVADKAESQDICFVAGDYRDFIRERVGGAMEPGPFLDREGRVLGRHRGLACYTVGQRRGLGLSGGRRLYVTGLDAAKNAVRVGPIDEVFGRVLAVEEVNFVSFPPPAAPVRVEVQLRYRAAGRPAVLRPLTDDGWEIEFDAGVRAIAPGQAAVFYREDYVWGGGRIKARIL